MIGNFKNPGACWEKQPQWVMDHDFRSDAKVMAVPYGIYDPARNQGFVVAGTSHETPAFAVDAVTLWWKSYGQRRYGRAKPHGLTVAVSHYPPGARAPLFRFLSHLRSRAHRLPRGVIRLLPQDPVTSNN